MKSDNQKRLERAQRLHQETLDKMPMADAVMHLAMLCAEREQQVEHWQHLAEHNAKAGR